MRTFNVFKPESDLASERDGYRWQGARVGEALGAEQIGATVYELEDGQRSHPYHFHHAVEEWLIVIAGSPVVRTADGERVLRRGDVLCFPPGAAGSHQVTGPGTVMVVAEHHAPDLVEYPDSGKVELRPAGTTFRTADAVELWQGE